MTSRLSLVSGEQILLSSLFGAKNPSVLLFSRERTLRLCFSRVDATLFLAGGHKALSRAKLDSLSRGQTFRLCFSRAVVKVCQAVKVWPLHGPNPPKFHL